MRIDDLNRSNGAQSAEKADALTLDRRSAGTSGKAVSNSDHADVSALARALSANEPKRIEELRLAIQSGKYDVPSEVVAGAVIDAHLTE